MKAPVFVLSADSACPHSRVVERQIFHSASIREGDISNPVDASSLRAELYITETRSYMVLIFMFERHINAVRFIEE